MIAVLINTSHQSHGVSGIFQNCCDKFLSCCGSPHNFWGSCCLDDGFELYLWELWSTQPAQLLGAVLALYTVELHSENFWTLTQSVRLLSITLGLM